MRLSNNERVLAWQLALHRQCHKNQLIYAVWGSDSAADGDGSLRALMFILRRKLAAEQIEVICDYDVGYYCPQRTRLHDLLIEDIKAGRLNVPGRKTLPVTDTAYLSAM